MSITIFLIFYGRHFTRGEESELWPTFASAASPRRCNTRRCEIQSKAICTHRTLKSSLRGIFCPGYLKVIKAPKWILVVNDKTHVHLIVYSSMCACYDHEQVNQVTTDDPSKRK